MNTTNLIRLLVLAAIWGGSFLFMRIAVPALGPALLIAYRVGCAALFLLLVGLVLRKTLDLRANWGHYLVLGFFNSALPFFLFAFAARTLSASVLPLFPAPVTPTIGIMGATLALGIVCSGITYSIYFKLIEEIGTTSALTVTFLTPAFGILWGALFLGEVVGWYTIVGAGIVRLGTALVTGFIGGPNKPALVAAR